MRSLLHAAGSGIDAAGITYAIGAYLRYVRGWPIRPASWVGFFIGVPLAVGTALLIEL